MPLEIHHADIVTLPNSSCPSFLLNLSHCPSRASLGRHFLTNYTRLEGCSYLVLGKAPHPTVPQPTYLSPLCPGGHRQPRVHPPTSSTAALNKVSAPPPPVCVILRCASSHILILSDCPHNGQPCISHPWDCHCVTCTAMPWATAQESVYNRTG